MGGFLRSLLTDQTSERVMQVIYNNTALCGRYLVPEAVKRTHFFTKPVDVPFVNGDNMFCLPRHITTKKGNGKAR